jgi:hypothetical protein
MNTSLSASRVGVLWLIANLMMASLFLLLASRTWIEPELAGVPGASGGAGVVWFVTALPVAGAAALVNLVAVVWALAFRIKHFAWPASSVAWFGLLVWLAAIVLDNSRHGV